MENLIAVVLLAVSALAMSQSANAAPCRDAKGKFIKCPPAAAASAKAATVKKAPCRDAKGKFKKC